MEKRKLTISKGNKKRLFWAIASVVVFITTYMLVLPALTIDEETAIQDPAISNETLTQEQVNELETVADPFTIEQEREDALANTEEKTEITDETSEESLNVLENEEVKEQEKEIKNTAEVSGDLLYFKDESTSVKVYVEAPLDAFPEGTYMVVTPIESHEVLDSVNTALDNTKAKRVEAVDITFYDKDGNEIEPATQIKVSLVSDLIKDSKDAQIVHIDNEGTGTVVTPSDEESADDEIIFESKDFSTYVVVVETEITITNDEGNNETYVVSVTYGPEANIPDGSTLRVKEFDKDSEEYDYARKAVLADKKEKGEYVDIDNFGFVALDISIIDPNGNEIEPQAAVKVDMKIKELPDVENLEDIKPTLEVQHHVEVEEGVVIDKVFDGSLEDSYEMDTDSNIAESGTVVDPSSVTDDDFKNQELPEINEEPIEVSFDTEVFSTFTITWRTGYYARTVTVHYVDESGNELTISNPDNTHPNMTANSSSPAFLIYDIDGYEYSYTYRNTNTNANRIAPLLSKNNNNYWRYTGTGNVNWTELSNNDNIYVVYKKKADPAAGGTPSTSDEETWPDQEDPARKPQFTKASTNNGNGTNNISLTITGPEKPVEKSTPADVIVVFDVSGSMGGDNIWRLNTAKTAVNNMADTLLNGENSNVRMALISYSTTAQQVDITGATNGFTSDYNNYRSAVNGLSALGGTNWEQGLQLANQLQVRSDAATFVVFVTDGDPTFRVSRGDVTNSNLDMYTSTTYQYYRNNHVFGTGSSDNQSRNFDFAVDQVKAIAAAKKNFYAIGISNDVTKVQNLTTEGGVAADHAFIASDSAAMERAFKSITESIKSTLGFGNVEITDGITALTNAEMKVMQSVDPNSFKYYRYGGENNKYGNGYANKTEWTTREADGCAAATYSESDGAVHWDMGETFQLENNVTYVVEFTVWPSQAAYDLIADLNNGLKTYDSLTEAEKAQVVEVTPPSATTIGTYALKTNTDEVNATYNRTTKTGDTVTISDTAEVTAEYKEGSMHNMELDSDYITVKKEWHNALDSRVVDGITLTVTKDGASYLDDVTLNNGNNWTSHEEYIAAGVITRTADGKYNVRETGHEYTVTEPAAFSYYWDLTADVYRPMVIDGTLKMLVKTDSPTGTEGTDYYVISGNSYQVSSTTHPQLVAQNDRRSNLNLKKLVTANTQAVDKVPNPDDAFTYTITVTDINGDAVWFGAQDESGATVMIESYSQNVTPEEKDGQLTGSYSVPSGAQFTISIKAGWNVRFFNLPTGTTYSIQETDMEDGYEFVKAETSAEVTKPEYAEDYKATPGTVNGDTVTGTIDQPNNVYSTEYTNNWNPNNEIVIIKTDETGTKLAGAQFKLSKMTDDGWTQIATFTSAADAGETLKVGRGFYMLEETAAPANYVKTETVYFLVTTSGNTTTVALTDEDGEEIADADLPTVYPDATASGNAVTIKNWPLTTAEATKAWANADGTTTAPAGATVVFTLYVDGEATEHTVTLDGTADPAPTGTAEAGYESEGWKAKFVNLPKYKTGTTTEIVYTIAETTTYPGYTASTTEPVANGGTITNTQEATTANALKAWENADGTTTAPEGATVVFTLYADGTATNYTVTLDGTVDTKPTGTAGYESEAWKAEFVNLPKYQTGTTTEIVYTIGETTTYPGYTASTTEPVASGETITNTQGSTETFALKAWKNADGSVTAPDGATVVFTLYSDGTITNYTVTLDGTVDPKPTGTAGYESEAWKASFVKLPESKIVDGEAVPIVYTIAETTTYPGYTPDKTDPVGSGSTITNSQDPTTANALKAWVNADGTTTAPQGGQVTYTLYADGKETAYTVTLDGTVDTAPEVTGGYEKEAWKAEFVNLPKYKAGTTTEIVYTIAETTAYPGYTPSTTEPVASGETITNTQEATTADAAKAWKNADGTTTPPTGASVVFTLYADGEETEYTVTLDGTVDETVPTGTAGYESEAWKALFINLPKYKVVEGAAVEIAYTIGETKTYPGYTPDKTAPVASGETITNSQDDIDVYATKAWLNANDTDTAPDGATVVFTLLADDEATEFAVTLNGEVDETVPTVTGGYESEAWKASFVNLPKYKADGNTEIVYTIKETTGYETYEMDPRTAVGNGGTITNKQISTPIEIKKIGDWTPEKTLAGVQFKLYSDEACTKQLLADSKGKAFGPNGVITTGEDGTVTVGSFIPGDYYLLEIATADGYNLLESAVKFTIKTDGTIEYSTGNKDFDSTTYAFYELKDGGYGIYINNPSGTVLPNTGGSGTSKFYILGSMLIAGSLMYEYSLRRNRKRKEVK